MWNSLKCSCTKTKYFPFTTITTVFSTEWYDTQYTIITHWHIFKQNSLSFISDTSWAVYVDTYYIFFFALSWYSSKLLNCSLRVQIAKLLPFKSLPFFLKSFFYKKGIYKSFSTQNLWLYKQSLLILSVTCKNWSLQTYS